MDYDITHFLEEIENGYSINQVKQMVNDELARVNATYPDPMDIDFKAIYKDFLSEVLFAIQYRQFKVKDRWYNPKLGIVLERLNK